MAKDELQRLSAKLEELKAKVNTIGNAIDEIQEYSFQYNVKFVGVSERLQDESAASISKLCLNIFKETGADRYRCLTLTLLIVFPGGITMVSQRR